MKDPAILLYYDKWVSSTNGMRADFRAWYLDLLIYQYDKGFIPNDFDELGGICRVRPSEIDYFKQMLEQVLKQKFTLCDDNTFKNDVASEILRKREDFKDKRAKSGTIGYIIKCAGGFKWANKTKLLKLKELLYPLSIDELESYKDIANLEQMLKQMLEQNTKLYINEDVDINKEEYSFIDKRFLEVFNSWLDYKKSKKQSYANTNTIKDAYDSMVELSGNNPDIAAQMVKKSKANNWAGLFELKQPPKQTQHPFAQKLPQTYEQF